MTLGRGRFSDGSQFADSLRIDNQFLSSGFVRYPCPAKLQGVIVSVVDDLEFTPEDTIDGGPIFHTGHIEFVGRHDGVQGDMLAWGQFEVEGRRHFEHRRGATGKRLSAQARFEVRLFGLTVEP